MHTPGMRSIYLYGLALALLLGCSDSSSGNGDAELGAAHATSVANAAQTVVAGLTQAVAPEMQGLGDGDSPAGAGDGTGSETSNLEGRDGSVPTRPRDGGVRDGAAPLRRDGSLVDRSRDGRGDDLGPCVPAAGKAWAVCGTLKSFVVAGTVSNSAGGSATVEGNGGAATDKGWQISVTITFSGWVLPEDAGTLDGAIDVVLVIESIGNPIAASATVSGIPRVTTEILVKGQPKNVTLPAPVAIELAIEGSTVTVCGTVAGLPVGTGPCAP